MPDSRFWDPVGEPRGVEYRLVSGSRGCYTREAGLDGRLTEFMTVLTGLSEVYLRVI